MGVRPFGTGFQAFIIVNLPMARVAPEKRQPFTACHWFLLKGKALKGCFMALLDVMRFLDSMADNALLDAEDVLHALQDEYPKSHLSETVIEGLSNSGVISLVAKDPIEMHKKILVDALDMTASVFGGLQYSSFNISDFFITKQSILKLEKIVAGESEGTPPNLQKYKRDGRVVLLVAACLHEWGRFNSELPASAEQLISYCMQKPPQGYKLIKKTQVEIIYSESGVENSVQLRGFKGILKMHLSANKGN